MVALDSELAATRRRFRELVDGPDFIDRVALCAAAKLVARGLTRERAERVVRRDLARLVGFTKEAMK